MKDKKWQSTKHERPNYKTMGLNYRALQNARIIEHNITRLTSSEADPHAAYREMFESKTVLEVGANPEDLKKYEDDEDELFQDTLRKLPVATTCSNAADSKLNQAKKPIVAIIDEYCSAQELETLIAWAHNSKTLLLIIFVGDPRQLPPTIKSKHMNMAEVLVNPFANQMVMSYFERLWHRGAQVVMFTEQHRAAAGLTDIYNELWYGGRITNAAGTVIADRPKAQEAINYIEKIHGAKDGIPHVCLHIPNGVCMRSDITKSRFNLHNVVAVVHEINGLLDDGIWEQDDITIITLYREQARVYREALAKSKLWKIVVITVDSFQGGQNRYVFFDIVLSYWRRGSWGFVKEQPRLNVGVSRTQDHFYFIRDIDALKKSPNYTATSDAMDDEERKQNAALEERLCKDLTNVYNYFSKKNVVVLVKPDQYEEAALVDFTSANQYREALEAAHNGEDYCRRCHQVGHIPKDCHLPSPNVECRNCNGRGHFASQCPQPRVFKGNCRVCGEQGHRKSECPNLPPRPCYKCSQPGHHGDACPNPDTRTCNRCQEVGHIATDCKNPRKKKIGFTLPSDEYSVEAGIENAHEYQRVVPDGWKVEVEDMEKGNVAGGGGDDWDSSGAPGEEEKAKINDWDAGEEGKTETEEAAGNKGKAKADDWGWDGVVADGNASSSKGGWS